MNEEHEPVEWADGKGSEGTACIQCSLSVCSPPFVPYPCGVGRG